MLCYFRINFTELPETVLAIQYVTFLAVLCGSCAASLIEKTERAGRYVLSLQAFVCLVKDIY